jgi:hypothetical protein
MTSTYSKYTYLCICAVYLGFASCRTDKKNAEISLSGIHKVKLLDSLSAAQTIVKDDLEKFFDNITPIDMMIQMKRSYAATTPRDSILADYKKYIQNDVSDFTAAEIDKVDNTMHEAFSLCNKVTGNIFPDEIKIIKSHGKHYGEDTYYTRENVIIVPKQALQNFDADVFLKVMLHEVSHIITRLNPTMKAKLYATIGFKKLASPLIINDSLKSRLLTNPDGHDLNWVTELTTAAKTNVYTLPIIYANENIYKTEKPEFFQYLGWNYFEILPSASGKELVVQTIGNQQKSTLNTEGITTVFKEKFNTDYIIHPDEIVADNFSILMYSVKNPKSLEAYSANGQKLLETMRGVLMEF